VVEVVIKLDDGYTARATALWAINASMRNSRYGWSLTAPNVPSDLSYDRIGAPSGRRTVASGAESIIRPQGIVGGADCT
jgi:hypothetical protein